MCSNNYELINFNSNCNYFYGCSDTCIQKSTIEKSCVIGLSLIIFGLGVLTYLQGANLFPKMFQSKLHRVIILALSGAASLGILLVYLIYLIKSGQQEKVQLVEKMAEKKREWIVDDEHIDNNYFFSLSYESSNYDSLKSQFLKIVQQEKEINLIKEELKIFQTENQKSQAALCFFDSQQEQLYKVTTGNTCASIFEEKYWKKITDFSEPVAKKVTDVQLSLNGKVYIFSLTH